MNAAEAYKASSSPQHSLRNKACDAGWKLPEYHDSHVIMRNTKTGEVVIGTRKWAASADRWSLRVSFSA